MGNGSAGKLDIGQVGERVVVQWLKQQGWSVLAERWHCRFGELDIVAMEPDSYGKAGTIAFIEVKARRKQNWDLDGLLSITPAKQRKLIKTAQLYLGTHPEVESLPCRFDVALVQVVKDIGTKAQDYPRESERLIDCPWVEFAGDRLRLREYLRNAFEVGS